MIIQIDNESILCNSFEEYEVQIYKIFELKTAEIWISENGGQDDHKVCQTICNGKNYRKFIFDEQRRSDDRGILLFK